MGRHGALVTVAIPTWNRAPYLRQALESVLQQTYFSLEVLVSDNASGDSTSEIISLYAADSRVRTWRHSVNLGMVGNWNSCIQQATGDYFILLSDDDYLEPKAIERLMNGFIDEPEAVQVIGRCAYVDENGSVSGTTPAYSGVMSGQCLARSSFLISRPLLVYPSATLQRVSALRAIGGYPDVGNQADLFARVAMALRANAPTVFIDSVVANYRVHSASLSASAEADFLLDTTATQQELRSWNHRLSYIDEHRSEWGPVWTACKRYAVLKLVETLIRSKEMKTAIRQVTGIPSWIRLGLVIGDLFIIRKPILAATLRWRHWRRQRRPETVLKFLRNCQIGNARVGLVLSNASPTKYTTYKSLANKVKKMQVILSTEREANRIWNTLSPTELGFTAKVLPGFSLYVAERDWGIYWNPQIIRELRELKPSHIIVHGYETPTYLAAILYAKFNRIPLVIWWGSHAMSSRSRRGPIAWIRRNLLLLGDAFVTYGRLSAIYLENMGIDADRIVPGINTVDVISLGAMVDANLPCSRSSESGPMKLLYVGQLIERKGVGQLLQALAKIPSDLVHLTIVGYGPMEQRLQSYVQEIGITNVIFAGGTQSSEENARFYAEANALIMPSHVEVWGLVVNEALAAGLYVLASKFAGAVPDLISEAPFTVGSIIDPFDVQGMAEELEKVSLRFRRGEVSRGAIAKWGRSHTPERNSIAVCKALEIASARVNG